MISESRNIGKDGKAVIVQAQSLNIFKKNNLYSFVRWLERKGFVQDKNCKGFYKNIGWVFVNIYSKTYFLGMPGIKVCKVITNKWLSIKEFKELYSSLKIKHEETL